MTFTNAWKSEFGYDGRMRRCVRREISSDQLGLLADWLSLEPEVPEGRWFKNFSGMIACGEGELIKTFLHPGQVATGQDLR